MLHIHISIIQLWLIDMRLGGGYKPLLECDIWREKNKYISSSVTEDGSSGGWGDAGAAPLELHYWKISCDKKQNDASHIR